MRKVERAVGLMERSIKQNPEFAPAWCNLGLAQAQLGHHARALNNFDKAIVLDTGIAEAWYNRGISLGCLNLPEDAVASFDKALAIKPDDAEAYNNRGLTLIGLRRYAEALASLDTVVRLNSRFALAHSNRGVALIGLKRPEDALASFQRALALDPGLAEAYCNRGDVLHDLNRSREAVASFEKALALKPDFAEAHFGLSLVLLAMGRYREGFRHLEWRKKRTNPDGGRAFPQPLWLGDRAIEGKTLFIHPELFLGDMINFSRYALMAAAKGAKVVLAVQEPLRELLTSLGPEIRIVGESEIPDRFDFHCPLMSLPLAFQTLPQSVPSGVPYLKAEPERSAAWRRTIGGHGFKVGICWQGSVASVEMGRTFDLARFADIARLRGVRLISLQTGEGSEQLANLPAGMTVETYDAPGGGLRRFVDTAAMMDCLDLVITADTAIAHLAGALGRPTWVVLKQIPDWRWGLEGGSTPWYPTARLFRQSIRNDWTNVFQDTHAALAEMVGNERTLD
jgi:tetratricopeptide (TPR) repeat protein